MTQTLIAMNQQRGEVVSVLDYGADPTGVSNSATAIQNAINAVAAAGGGTVYLPEGNYNIATTTITFPEAKMLLLIGAGSTSSGNGATQVPATQITYSGTGNAIEIHGSGFDATQCGGALRDLYIQGPGTGGATRGISIRYVSGSTGRFDCRNVFTNQFNIGWKLDALFDSHFDNCHSRGCTTGWDLRGAAEAVNANTFTRCGDDSSITGLYMQDGVNGNTFLSCIWQGNSTAGVDIYGDTFGPRGNDFIGNWWESPAAGSKGVWVHKAGGSTEPQNNRFIGGLSTSWAIGFDLEHGNRTIIRDVKLDDYYDRVLAGQFPAVVRAGATDTLIDLADNYSPTPNNDFGVGSAGAGTVIRDWASGALRTRIVGSSGNIETRSNGDAHYYRNLSAGTVYHNFNTSSGNPRQELLNGAKLFQFSGNFTGDLFRAADGYIAIKDGITAPGTITGMGAIYIDTADGDLKIKFADGTVKTIVTDT